MSSPYETELPMLDIIQQQFDINQHPEQPVNHFQCFSIKRLM